MRQQIIFRFSIRTREIHKVNWIVEVPAEVYKILIEKGRIYETPIAQSQTIHKRYEIKCFGYRHIAKNCFAKEQLCEKCVESGHLKASCPVKENRRVSINCKKFRRKDIAHSVRDTKCPEYETQLELYVSKIEWG